MWSTLTSTLEQISEKVMAANHHQLNKGILLFCVFHKIICQDDVSKNEKNVSFGHQKDVRVSNTEKVISAKLFLKLQKCSVHFYSDIITFFPDTNILIQVF
jgi:hypothetical protein